MNKELKNAWSQQGYIFWYDMTDGFVTNGDWVINIKMIKNEVFNYARYFSSAEKNITELQQQLEDPKFLKTSNDDEINKINEDIKELESEIEFEEDREKYYIGYQIEVFNIHHSHEGRFRVVKELDSHFPVDNRLDTVTHLWEDNVVNYEVDLIKYVGRMIDFIEHFVKVKNDD